jgi:two-component system KDP operon response regulator KdpE
MSAPTISPLAGSILLVDDDTGIRRALRASLGTSGYQTDEAVSGEQGILLAQKRNYEAVLLDMNMPGKGGIDTCRELRRLLPQCGILMLSVRDGEGDKVEALDAGADDYLTKPFVIRELTARLRAVRRGRAHGAIRRERIAAGGIVLDTATHQVERRGAAIHLTPKEFELLGYLMSHAGVTIRHHELLQAIWGAEYGDELEYLRTLMRQLRKKLEDDPSEPRYLITEAFIGYRFEAPDDRLPAVES